MGKSTSAQQLGRDHGYVYYEADCFKKLSNPYVPLSVNNPSLAHINQKILKGPGAEERKAMIQRTSSAWSDLMVGKELNMELMLEFFEHLALDIRREKERIGGDFAIAMSIPKKEVREHLRKILGSDLIIVFLNMSKEERRERVLIRHPGDHAMVDRMDVSQELSKNLHRVLIENNSVLHQPDGRTGRWGAEHCRGEHHQEYEQN